VTFAGGPHLHKGMTMRLLLAVLLASWPAVNPGPAAAQTRLTLDEAVARARTGNPDARIAEVAEREAAARLAQARAWYFPRVDFTESWQRGDHPVFVFSSLLAQRQFTADRFAIDQLNHPDAVNNFRSAFLAQQILFDGGSVRAGVRQARLGAEAAAVSRTQVQQELAVAATDAFGQVLQAAAARRAAASAVAATDQDLARTRHRRDAGVVTDADVLTLEAHAARVREAEVAAAGHERVARTRLNQVMGEPLDARFELDDTPLPSSPLDAARLESEALTGRTELELARIQESLAEAAVGSARSGFFPQVAAQGGVEWNGGTFGSRESAWLVGTEVRINLFRGFADRARLEEARLALTRRALEREKAETGIRLDVRNAMARLETAQAREAVGRAAEAQAREAQRIVRDRYEAGLADVTALLRAAEAVQAAEAQAITARVDVLLQAAALDRAVGR
jgi:outer membrane protein TolC